MTKLAKSVASLITNMAEGQCESPSPAALRDTLAPKLTSSALPEEIPARFIDDAIA